jgi:hypothetical protein
LLISSWKLTKPGKHSIHKNQIKVLQK